jgi:hypothetical protein
VSQLATRDHISVGDSFELVVRVYNKGPVTVEHNYLFGSVWKLPEFSGNVDGEDLTSMSTCEWCSRTRYGGCHLNDLAPGQSVIAWGAIIRPRQVGLIHGRAAIYDELDQSDNEINVTVPVVGCRVRKRLVGRRLQVARRTIERAGCRVKGVRSQTGHRVPRGVVFDTYPPTAEDLPFGSRITLYVSRGR